MTIQSLSTDKNTTDSAKSKSSRLKKECKSSKALWRSILEEVKSEAKKEPLLSSFFYSTILNHQTMEGAISFHLANKLDSPTVPAMQIREIFEMVYKADPCIMVATEKDIRAVLERDPVCELFSTPILYFKGFHALQSYRIAHWLWLNDRQSLALFFQNRISQVFGVDVHPAAKIGSGILFDHATGIVIGETAVVEDKVSILQSVTLGGTGKATGDRHPKVRKGVLISVGAKILGNVEIGEGAKVGGGSVVLNDVPAHTTVAGVPAKIVGKPRSKQPALDMRHDLPNARKKTKS